MSSISIPAYFTLFAGAGVLLVFVALLLGRFFRPQAPSAAKLESYECGEPPVGSANVQFDLRFYVVALVFIIFEVEVAFFFPWATVYGSLREIRAAHDSASMARPLSELGVPQGALLADRNKTVSGAADAATSLALAAMADMAAFFGVLLVGFAYLWRRGDLNWVRAVSDDSPVREATFAGAAEHSVNSELSAVWGGQGPRRSPTDGNHGPAFASEMEGEPPAAVTQRRSTTGGNGDAASDHAAISSHTPETTEGSGGAA